MNRPFRQSIIIEALTVAKELYFPDALFCFSLQLLFDLAIYMSPASPEWRYQGK